MMLYISNQLLLFVAYCMGFTWDQLNLTQAISTTQKRFQFILFFFKFYSYDIFDCNSFLKIITLFPERKKGKGFDFYPLYSRK